MYISRIRIENYRCFHDTTVELKPHLNVIIGENNAGKSTLLQALALIFGKEARPRIDLHDFYQGIKPANSPPSIRVTVTLRSEGPGKDTLDDRALVATWITQLHPEWEAQLTFEFSLPEEQVAAFAAETGEKPDRENYRKVVGRFLGKYTSRIYGGDYENRNRADPDALSQFRLTLLDAIRDTASDMSSGSNPLMRRMLQQVLNMDEDTETATQIKKDNLQQLDNDAEKLAHGLVSLIRLEKLTALFSDTGAEDGGIPKLSGESCASDLISALELYVEQHTYEFPVDRNGLGYNNLIFISLILASLDLESNMSLNGPNTILFPILGVEEPEAHLHPALQYKLLKSIKHRLIDQRSRQIFITTHSTHITAACDLDDIICFCCTDDDTCPRICYPGKAFPDTPAGDSSKKYVQRYLDATKSNLLFSKGVIFVEGITEQLLFPRFAELVNSPLEKHHVALIAVGGSTFTHFLYLFGADSPTESVGHTLDRRVACIVDADPARLEQTKDKPRWKGCWPYQLDADSDLYKYRLLSPVISNLMTQKEGRDHIAVFYGHKTLEYDIAFENAKSPLLPDDSSFDELDDFDADGLDRAGQDAVNARYATQYLITSKVSKGQFAYDLDQALRINAMQREDKCLIFRVPKHIKQAIMWACRNDGSEVK
jgi:putative ATP-dependent endonuclease of OLD family